MLLSFLPLAVMDQEQYTSTQITFKDPTTLETIPEDVAVIIAEHVKSWADIDANLDQKEKAKSLRDSTLRAIALSCRKSYDVYLPILLQNVTLDFKYILSFYELLKRETSSGKSIQNLHVTYDTEEDEEVYEPIFRELALMSDLQVEDSTAQVFDGIYQVTGFIYQELISLQSLFVEHGFFIPPSFEKPWFSSSLKKLYIPPLGYSEHALGRLNARNVIWILSFGSLREAVLGFILSNHDVKFLAEHHHAFFGNSKVRKLSLGISFVYKESDRSTWWGLPKETRMGYLGGNKKTEAVGLMLKVVNQVDCLEVRAVDTAESNPGDTTRLNLGCLSSLTKSSGCLRHVRLIDFYSKDGLEIYSLLRSVKTLSLDLHLLRSLKGLRVELPASLEKVILLYYLLSKDPEVSFTEDCSLIQVIKSQLKSQFLPNLKEILVPSTPISSDGAALNSVEWSKELKVWAHRRNKLENEPIFKNGRVKLRTFSPGEIRK